MFAWSGVVVPFHDGASFSVLTSTFMPISFMPTVLTFFSLILSMQHSLEIFWYPWLTQTRPSLSSYFIHKCNVDKATPSCLKAMHPIIMLYEECTSITINFTWICFSFSSAPKVFFHVIQPFTYTCLLENPTDDPWKDLRLSKSKKILSRASL